MNKALLQQALDVERVAFNNWRNDFINEHGHMPTEADAWKARAAIAQPAAPVAPITGLLTAHARTTLIQSLVASKGWMRGYAEAFVDDFADSLRTTPVAQAEPIKDAARLEWVISNSHMRVQGGGKTGWAVMDCSNGLTFLVRGEKDWRAAIDAAIAKDATP